MTPCIGYDWHIEVWDRYATLRETFIHTYKHDIEYCPYNNMELSSEERIELITNEQRFYVHTKEDVYEKYVDTSCGS